MSRPKASGRSRNLLDLYVARRVRSRRLQRGVSQQELAERTGLTVQQIHKYEHGTNRISASRLVAIGLALETPPADFYVGADVLRRAIGPIALADDADRARDVCDLLIAVTDAKTAADRRRLLELVRSSLRGQQLKDRAQAVFALRPVRPQTFAYPRYRPASDSAAEAA